MSGILIRVAVAIAFCVVLAGGSFVSGYSYAGKRFAEKYEKQALRLAEAQKEQNQNTDKIVTQYVDRVKTIEVVKYVPSPDECKSLSGNFRLFYDAAATGYQLPEAAGVVNAPAVPLTTVADSLSNNFISCRKNLEQLTALQKWAQSVSQ